MRSGFPDDQAAAVADEVLGVMTHPDLAPLFGPGSRAEVPLTGVIGDAVIGGLVDRLMVGADRVLIADFKTNRDAAIPRRGHAGDVSAADGVIPIGVAGDFPWQIRQLCA